jgi:hypothetical protein
MGFGALKSVAFSVLATVIGVTSTPAPAGAQENFPGFVLARVCLPYANRAKSFESAMSAARDMGFRRPAGDRAPLEDWASEVELIHRDGRWRVRIEEGPAEEGGVEAYAVTCSIWSNMAGSHELGRTARLVVGRSPHWSQASDAPWRWDRRTERSGEYALRIEVTQEPERQPVLAARGLYY